MRKVINVPIQKIRVCEDNPRNNALAIDKVKASIERVGFMFPIIIDMNYVIVAGHTRRAACEALGIQSIPCIMVDDLDQEQVDLFRFVDNKTSEYASWNYAKLAEELRKIDNSLGLNELILESFDFDLEAHELDVVPTAVTIPTFNFMGGDYKKNAAADKNGAVVDEDLSDGGIEDDEEWAEENTDDIPDMTVKPTGSGGASDATVFGAEQKTTTPTIHTFRCGANRFIISEREEERLLEAYTRYMAEVYPESSFIKYLLGGAENVEIQSESAD